MAMTVTATQTANTSQGMLVRVKVLTGAKTAAAQTGATAAVAGVVSTSITTTTTGSIVYGALTSGSGAFAAQPLCTLIDNYNDAVNSEQYGSFRTTSPTGTPGSTLIGSSTTPSFADIAAVEILPNGTIAEDASAPVVATGDTSISLATASFTPPAGSLLVVMIGSDGAANGIGNTAYSVFGGGLTWTEIAHAVSSSTCYAGVWIADAPSAAAAPAISSVPLYAPGWRPGRGLPTNGPGGTPFYVPPTPTFVPGVTTVPVGVADSGSGADAVSVAATAPVIDAGAGADAVAATAVAPLGDGGSGTDSLGIVVTLALPDSGAAADTLDHITLIGLADAGSGADALSVTAAVALPDAGSALDTLLAMVTAGLPDAGAGADAVAIAVTAALADAGSGADLLATSRAVGLADAGSGAEALAASAAVSLAEAGTGTDALAVTAGLSLADSGSGGDGMAVAAQAVLSDSGAAQDQLQVSVSAGLPDAGSGADTEASAAAVALLDAGIGADSVTAAHAGQPTPSDAGTGTDTLSAAAAVQLADGGTGTDSLAVSVAASLADSGSGAELIAEAVSVQLADAGSSASVLVTTALLSLADAGISSDALTGLPPLLNVALADGGTGTDTLSVVITGGNTPIITVYRASMPPRRWQSRTDTRWSVRLTSWDQAAALTAGRWHAAARSRWQVIMADIDPVWSGSLEQIPVIVTSDLAGTSVDPTATPPQMAFPVSSGNPASPATPVTFFSASWLAGTTIRGYVAQCLVGPGGATQLAKGSYDVWVKLTSAPETPVIFAGTVRVI